MASEHRPTYVEIDLDALTHNFRLLQSRAGAARRILAVVKADGYGHGALPIALELEGQGVEMFGVAMVEEGVELRRAGVRTPILVLGGVYDGQEELLVEHGLTPCVFDFAGIERLERIARSSGASVSFHLKLDTGMARLGFRPDHLPAVLERLQGCPALQMEGFLSHLALADENDRPENDAQIALFRDALARVRQAGFAPRYVHLSNSASLLSRDLPECNLVRPGIALYGALPDPCFDGSIDLHPVMSFRSAVAQLKSIPAGAGASYGHRFVAKRPTLLAAVPVGYADGYSRSLSSRAEVLIRGQRAPVAGTVCMDWILVDVTDIPGVCTGDVVTLLGRDNGNLICVQELADLAGTIPYEIFCQISKRVPRTYPGMALSENRP